MEPYKYHPVNEEKEEIRMLTIHPGPFDSAVRVSLSNIPFPKNAEEAIDVPEFEALSYTWGSPNDPKDIIVQSESGIDTTLSVTQNLSEALPYLRYPDQPRTLWIDAIAVDQANMNERTSQVQRMSDIYTRASRVVVWLGIGRHDSSLALETIRMLNTKIQISWKDYALRKMTEEEHWRLDGTPLPFSDAVNSSLLGIYEAGWFNRLWIMQEIRLASPESLVMVGHLCMEWTLIVNALFVIYLKSVYATSIALRLWKRVANISNTFDQRPYDSMLALVVFTDRCQCMDPRDRFYALLSLCKKYSIPFDIKPDYTQSLEEVYRKAALEWVRSERNLDVLECCSADRRLEGGTSWVPNHSIPDGRQPLWSCPAAFGTSPVWKHIPRNKSSSRTEVGDVLETLGMRVGTVKIVGTVSLGSYNQGIAIGFTPLKKITHQFVPLDEFPPGSARFQAFARTVNGGQHAGLWHPQRAGVPTMASIYECISDIQQDRNLDVHGSALSSLHWHCDRRTVFLTEEGHLGLGPNIMQPGDIVAILLGKWRSVSILRSKYDPDLAATYEYVGNAYYDDYMRGEAFLGPIPMLWELHLNVGEKAGSIVPNFVNSKTGEVRLEDPRRGELPDGWRKGDDPEKNPASCFVHEDGRVAGLDDDPRLLPEELRKKGVSLETFRLV